MKKVISTIALIIISAISVNGQEKKQAATSELTSIDESQNAKNKLKEISKRQTSEITDYLKLDEKTAEAINNILEYKNEISANSEMSPDEKAKAIKKIESKINYYIDPKYMEMLKNKPELYKILSSEKLPKT